MTETRPLYSQPFTNSHFYFPITLESVTCQVLLQWCELHYSVLSLSSAMMYMLHQLSTAYLHRDIILKTCAKMGQMHQHVWGI